MPIADKSTPGVPEGTRISIATVDVPGDAIRSVGGRTRALTYASNAIDRAAQEWFTEHRVIPNWEDMQIVINFTSFAVTVEINDRFAHGPVSNDKDDG